MDVKVGHANIGQCHRVHDSEDEVNNQVICYQDVIHYGTSASFQPVIFESQSRRSRQFCVLSGNWL